MLQPSDITEEVFQLRVVEEEPGKQQGRRDKEWQSMQVPERVKV